MKKFKNGTKIIAVILLAVTFILPQIHLSSGAVYASSLEELHGKNIITGYEDGELHPERLLTRAQFARIIRLAFKDITHTEVLYDFHDVSNDHWAFNDIQFAANAGLLKGYDNGNFGPDDNITYEQAAAIMCRLLHIGGLAEYPEDYISAAIDSGITDGVDAAIGEAINREQAARFILNTLKAEEIEADEEDYQNVNISSMMTGYLANMGAKSAAGGGAAVADGYVEEAEAVPGARGGGYSPYYYFEPVNTEEYTSNEENIFKNAVTSPLSTFSIDTDTASYSNLRRFILNGQEIPAGSIRSEELINYFSYAQAQPQEGTPFGVNYKVGACPWNSEHMLAMLTVSGEQLKEKKPSNLVFLIDTSGSMYDSNKLPIVKQALSMLLDRLDGNDRISIVTYASGTSVALEPTPANEKEKILSAAQGLHAYGGTAGEDGINLAYEQAEKYKTDGNNRIILCTDGDFNIGASSQAELEKLIVSKRKSGIFLTVLGFGMYNYKDSTMELLADKGNGNYAYIDNLREAKKVFVDEMPKTLYTVAKDVKIQVEFNPEKVAQYRLIGYENRLLNNEDFENDKKDAGELGSGATVTVLYELVPSDGTIKSELKYQKQELVGSDELMTVKIRYKMPNSDESELVQQTVTQDGGTAESSDFSFAAAVAELGMILNDSDYKGSSSYDSVLALAKEGMADDPFGIRCEFVQLVDLLKYKKS